MRPFAKLQRFALVTALAATMAACGGGSDEDKYVERPVEDIYNDAMDALLAGNYVTAAESFDEVERQHPYSTWATKAQLMSAYAYFEADEYDDAVIGVDRYIQLHPGSPDIAYAYYLKALAYYEQISDVGRDQRMTRMALNALDEVVRRFPNTEYARDARLKIDLTRDHLAGKEMEIGRFYLRNGNLLAAINRFKTVVEEYQTTTHVPEALHRMTEAYTALGLASEARRIASVLGYNYPGSEWYEDTYALVAENRTRPEAYEGGFLARNWERLTSPRTVIGHTDPREAEVASSFNTRPTGPTSARVGVGSTDAGPPPDPLPEAASADAETQQAAAGLQAQAAAASAARQQAQQALAQTQQAQAQAAQAAEASAALQEITAQRQASVEAARQWREQVANLPQGPQRENAQRQLAVVENAVVYWDASARVAQLPENDPARAAAEEALAEAAVDYWRARVDAATDASERSTAQAGLDEAQRTLTYWRNGGDGNNGASGPAGG